MITTTSPHYQSFVAGITILIIGACISVWWFFGPQSYTCNPQRAEADLSNYTAQGILQIEHPPSMSNLLWVHVGPEWHALSRKERRAIDKIVQCAATIFDDLGQTTWQAAYYDRESGDLVALTSKKYGFRIQPPSAL